MVARSTVQVSDFLDDWLVAVRARLRPSTFHSYEMAVGRIKLGLGRYQLQSLTPRQIEKFYDAELVGGGKGDRALAPKTVRNTHVVLRKALADAERLDLVSRNAAAAARPPVAVKADLVTWSSDDLRVFLNAIVGNRLEIGYRLLAATGAAPR